MKQHAPFLLEIGTEEIPARMASGGATALRDRLVTELETLKIPFSGVSTAVTPRRLVLMVDSLGLRQPDRDEEFVGPSAAAAFKDGVPSKAAEGFAKGKGVDVADLYVIDTPKGSYVAVRKQFAGQPTQTVLQDVLPRVIAAIPWPKSMRWGRHKDSFVRPIHWIVALLDSEVVPFSFIGVESGRITRGHRFLAPAHITLEHPSLYKPAMLQSYVMLSPEERRQVIDEGIQRLANQVGGVAIADPELLDEVQHLIEWPAPTLGTFPESFAHLPREVLISSMRSHQRYFAIRHPDSDKLMNHFVFVSNMIAKDMAVVAKGNERVLAARLSDARFFFQEDTRRPLESYLSALEDRIFLAGLGTVKEKSDRVRVVVNDLGRLCAPEATQIAGRAALLCKADLGTRIVGEFPDLQGIIGRQYAQISGESPEVSIAIEEHYRPRFAGDPPATSKAGALVAIADRLDSLIGCFGMGLIPTGTQDPYALRRGALGLIHTLTTHQWPIPLSSMVDMALSAYDTRLKRSHGEIRTDVDNFVRGRMRNLLANDYATDVIDAVLGTPDDVVTHLVAKVQALDSFRKRPDFEPLAITFKRVMNITKDQSADSCSINPALFEHEAENILHTHSLEVGQIASELLQSQDFPGTLAKLSTLKHPVDHFFDSVMVMALEPDVRKNRLALLFAVRRMFTQIADFSRIST